jgi:hypothetical protein
MADGLVLPWGAILATNELGNRHYVRTKVAFGADCGEVCDANPLPVSITGGLSGGLTDAQLRASAVPVSGTVGISGTVPVSGTFWQATQPVSIAATVNVSGPLTDTQLRASAVPVSGTFWQATQPVSIGSTVNVSVQNASLAVTAPTLTKGTQGANGFSTQDLKDAGRVIKVYSATFTAATTEALITLTPISDGAAGGTATSFAVTNGKRFRIQSLAVTVRNAGAAAQGVIVNLRMSASGAVTASSPLIGTVGAGTYLATANVVGAGMDSFPDGIELSGTMQFGISQVGTATAGNTVTLIGYEY